LFLQIKKGNIRYILPKGILILLFFVLGLVIIYNFTNRFYDLNWVNHLQALNTDGGSGRVKIWKNVIELQYKSGIFEWIFGHGDGAVAQDNIYLSYGRYINESAHNDPLEIIYDYGITTFFIYIYIFIRMLANSQKMLKTNYPLTAPYFTSVIIYMVMSINSHLIIYPTYFVYLVAFWGICTAQFETYETLLGKQKNMISKVTT
jgi:O-antigen ligase